MTQEYKELNKELAEISSKQPKPRNSMVENTTILPVDVQQKPQLLSV
jgi:hypothetical protein